jgi:mono/diheme cytochrome c family protein
MVANDSLCIMMSEEGLMSSRVVLLFLFLILHWLSFPDVGAAQQSSEKALREHYDLQEGKRLYGEYCRFCHGEQGKGHAFNVTPSPADLTSPAVQRKSDIELTQTIHEGERGTAMGSWKWALSKKEKQEVLLYIRWLSQSRQPVSASSP